MNVLYSKKTKIRIITFITVLILVVALISSYTDVNAATNTSSIVGDDSMTVSANSPTVGSNYTINGKTFKCIRNNGSDCYSFMSTEALGTASYDTVFNKATGKTFTVNSTYHPATSQKILVTAAYDEEKEVSTTETYYVNKRWLSPMHSCGDTNWGPDTWESSSPAFSTTKTKVQSCALCSATQYTQSTKKTRTVTSTETEHHDAVYKTVTYPAYYTYTNNATDISNKNIASANADMQSFLNDISDISYGSKGLYLLSESDTNNSTILNYAKACVGSSSTWSGKTPSTTSDSVYYLNSSGIGTTTAYSTAYSMYPVVDIDFSKTYINNGVLTKKPTSITLTQNVNTVYNGDDVDITTLVSDVKYNTDEKAAYSISIDSSYGTLNGTTWHINGANDAIVPVLITSKNFGLTKTINVQLYSDYDIIYNLNGGALDMSNPSSYQIRSEDFTLNNPHKTGYTFIGWTGTGLTEPTLEVIVPIGSTKAREYTANWKANNYNVTLDDNGGENGSEAIVVTYDSPMSDVQVPTRYGYNFLGYYKEDIQYVDNTGIGTATWDIPYDVSLVAKWEGIKSTVTFDSNEADNYGTTDVIGTFGSNLESVAIPEKEGHVFKGYFDENNEKYIDENGEGIKEWDKIDDTTLTAMWELVPYDISYELNGGEVDCNPTTYNRETPTFTLNNPTKYGYDFIGWSGTGLTDSSIEVTIEEGTIGDKEYTANWEPVKKTISFYLGNGNLGFKDDSNGNITPNIQEDKIAIFDDDMPSVPVPNANQDYYEFNGYYDDNGIQYYDKEGKSARIWDKVEDTTLHAEYTPIEYTIIYEPEGGEVTNNPTTYNVETDTFILNTPKRDGYIFTGWSTHASSDAAINIIIEKGSHGNREYTANWVEATNKIYLLTDENASTDSAIKVDVATGYSIPNVLVPEKDGKVFLGYYYYKTDDEGNIIPESEELYIDEQGLGRVVFDKIEDIVLIAKWNNKQNTILPDNASGTDGYSNIVTHRDDIPGNTAPITHIKPSEETIKKVIENEIKINDTQTVFRKVELGEPTTFTESDITTTEEGKKKIGVLKTNIYGMHYDGYVDENNTLYVDKEGTVLKDPTGVTLYPILVTILTSINAVNITGTDPLLINTVDNYNNVEFLVNTNNDHINIGNSVITGNKTDSSKIHSSIITLTISDEAFYSDDFINFNEETVINIPGVEVTILSKITEPTNEITFLAKYDKTMGLIMHRFYDPTTHEHLYTYNEDEITSLISNGWQVEGIGFVSATEGEAVYRVFNPFTGEHLYTESEYEKDMLVNNYNWQSEGVAWHIDNELCTKDVYRLYCPYGNGQEGTHHFTTSESERDWLVSLGWTYEGVAFKAI